jgi:hypothetical protein
MFQILYRCLYREKWYDDIPPFADAYSAVYRARQLGAERQTPTAVVDLDAGVFIYPEAWAGRPAW